MLMFPIYLVSIDYNTVYRLLTLLVLINVNVCTIVMPVSTFHAYSTANISNVGRCADYLDRLVTYEY